MSEAGDFIGGAIGGDSGTGGEAGASKAAGPSTLDPIAAALAVHAAQGGETLDPQLRAYLEKHERLVDAQERLVRIQIEEADEQHSLQLTGLKLRQSIDRMKLGLQLFLALVATALAAAVLVMVYDAATSRAVVVDAFKAPSDLAGRGLTGDVVASGVLDALQKMQQATRTVEKRPDARGSWASDIKIQVPETGVSIGEIDRLLHQRLGHDLHIGGELVRTGTDGLAITVRGDGVPGATFTGEAGDLDKLTAKAAEYVYGRSQPENFATYLVNHGRYAEAIAFIQGAYPRADSDADRARLANTLGNAHSGLYEPQSAAKAYRLSMSLLKPRTKGWWKAWGNMVGAVEGSEGEEAGWREAHAFLAAQAAAPKGARAELRMLYNAAQMTWDLPLALNSNLQDSAFNGGAGAGSNPEGPAVADSYGLLHDPAMAQRYLAASDPDDAVTKVEGLLLDGYAALDRGDAKAASEPLEAFYKAWLADKNIQYTYNYAPCFTGLADGLSGDLRQAEEIFARISRESLCVAFHGDVLAHAGDVAGAERVWAEGARKFPDLPTVPLHRGLYELGEGDLKAAEADLAAAAAKGPHWAETWKAWGDLLAREGRWREAVAKYDEAGKYAPAWAGLHAARAVAARQVR